MIVVVDTGGTKTLISSFTDDGTRQEITKFPTPKDEKEYVRIIRSTLKEQYGETKVDALTIALPGMIKDGVALWCANLGWENFNARQEFTGVLGDAKVFVENDANLAGLGEAKALQPTPATVIYITVSTGIGLGIITNGQINPSLSRSEGGHMVLDFNGAPREWEHFASGRAIFEAYKKYGHDITDKKTWQEIADRISRGFLAIIPIIQPDVIIFGGSMGAYFSQFGPALESILREKSNPHIPRPQLIQASRPQEAVLYGGYYHALDNLAHQ